MPGVRLLFQCVVCKTRTNPKNRRKINSELKQLILKRLPIELKDTDVLCNKCRIKHSYKLSPVENFNNKLIDQSYNEEYQPPVSKKTSFASPPSVRLNIPSTPKSHSRCFICKRPGPKLKVVPSEARFTAFVQQNVIIKSGTRCCPVHMDESQIKDKALQSVKASESAFVNRATVLELLNKLRASCNKNQKRFDFNTLNNEEYVDLTGLNKEAIRDICAGSIYWRLCANNLCHCNKYLPPLSSSCSNDAEDFPRLTEDILRTLTCGVYQLKLCPGYIQEHLEGDEDIRVHKERSGLIRVRLQSRHVSAKQYNLWIKFNNYEILGWYCKCRSGSRIVGMCAHCAAVIWYLGYGKHRCLGALGVRDWSEYVDDASVVPPTVDSSDSDSD
ncbi:hypothetical protein MAR_005678 [Mya arenaria]|uniref:SWIM-type domain-containing protein n=1 Tax=Mya arenaria TaxID=6604 RepID=A0ABY7F062_MYAAR|nr:hypothetical protein MAR_005678 [Mya arenaria]